MVTENDMVMELFRDDPNRKKGVFQVLANFYVPKCLKHCQKSKLCFLVDAMQRKVILKLLLAIKTVRSWLSWYEQIHQLLCTVTMMTN